MKEKSLLIVLILMINSLLFCWGDDGHKLIAQKSLELLPSKMHSLLSWRDEIIKRSVDPDYRKEKDKSEGIKHYIDIDYYPEYFSGEMITDKESLSAKYSADTVNNQGILPWAILGTYNSLVDALKKKNKEKTLLYLSDLAHYIGDANQPMHTVMNYNGQLSGQKGVHARYEIFMIQKYLPELSSKKQTTQVEKILDIKNYIFNMITETNTYNPVLLAADKKAAELTKNDFNDSYYKIMWHQTKPLTFRLIDDASLRLASLYVKAWEEAGKPDFKKFR